MKNKGFTLIELLAVIVILAIIALIVAPIILGIITDAKKSSTKESARAYLKAIEQQIVMNLIRDVELTDGIHDVPIAGIDISGQTPDGGWVVIENEGIVNYALKYGDFIITYETEEMIIKTGGILPSKPE